MQMSTQKKKQTPIEKLAALIVDKRKAFYLFYIIAGIFCAISTGWTKVNNDITSYLPDSSETWIQRCTAPTLSVESLLSGQKSTRTGTSR